MLLTISIISNELFNNLPKIIAEASKSYLGVISLAIIAVSSIIIFLAFVNRSISKRHQSSRLAFVTFSLVIGVALFGLSIIREIIILSKPPVNPPFPISTPTINICSEILQASENVASPALNVSLSEINPVQSKEIIDSLDNAIELLNKNSDSSCNAIVNQVKGRYRDKKDIIIAYLKILKPTPTSNSNQNPSININQKQIEEIHLNAVDAVSRAKKAWTKNDLIESRNLLMASINRLSNLEVTSSDKNLVSQRLEKYNFALGQIDEVINGLNKSPTPPELQDSCFIKLFGDCSFPNISSL